MVQTSFPALLTSTPPRGTSSLKKHNPGVLWNVAWGMSWQADGRRCLNSPIIVQQLTWPPSVVGPMEPRRGELGVRRVPNNLLHSLSEQLEAPVRGDSCQSQVLFANLERRPTNLENETWVLIIMTVMYSSEPAYKWVPEVLVVDPIKTKTRAAQKLSLDQKAPNVKRWAWTEGSIWARVWQSFFFFC